MRLSTKLGASVSTAALGAAVVFGGAGVAQAQSLGYLGSSDPAPIVLTVSGDVDGVGGTITNNTEASLTCYVIVSDAKVISAVENDIDGGMTFAEAFAMNDDAFQAANAEGKNAYSVGVLVLVGETEVWTGIGIGPDADYRAGAVASCGEEIAFAYEPGGIFGSLDMGSLGS